MKYLKITLAIIWISFYWSCKHTDSRNIENYYEYIEETEWEYIFSQNDSTSIDYFKFYNNNEYLFYSAEARSEFLGLYYFQNDTINLVELGRYDDLVYPGGTLEHQSYQKVTKGLIANDTLKLIYFKTLNKGEWVKSNHIFPNYYLFSKNK